HLKRRGMTTDRRRQAPATPSRSWSPASICFSNNWKPSAKGICSSRERDQMLVTVLGFGSIWERKPGRQAANSARFGRAAYYNTSGVAVNGKVRYRWRIGGKIRFNSVGGFNPNYPLRALNRVFECEPPEQRPG